MPDTYFNPNSVKPAYDFKPQGALAGMLWDQDRTRYNELAPLSDMLYKNDVMNTMLDNPVKEQKRLADIATHQGTQQTAVPMAHGNLEKLRLGNEFDRRTMEPRVSNSLLEAKEKGYNFETRKLREGITYATMMMESLGQYGPAGAANVVKTLRERGIDVQNDPVVNYVMSTNDPNEMRRRVQQVQEAYNNADQSFRTSQMQQHWATVRQQMGDNRASAVASIRAPGEKEHEDAMKILRARLKEMHPDWTEAQIGAEALRQYQAGRYGQTKVEGSLEQGESKTISELERIIPFLPQGSTVRTQVEEFVRSRRQGRGAPAGTPENPIRIP